MITLTPAFADAVTVFLASDAKYLPNTAVTLYSLIAHASPNRFYDLILLHNGIDAEPLSRFCGMAQGRENISVRAFDLSEELSDEAFFYGTRPDFSAVTFYRLLIPWLLPEATKAVYLDGDVLARTDIAQLYDMNMGECLIAAALDICIQGDITHQ